jgi:hypothetical protein
VGRIRVFEVYERVRKIRRMYPMNKQVILASETMIASWREEVREATNRKYLPARSVLPPSYCPAEHYHIGGVRVIPVGDKLEDLGARL